MTREVKAALNHVREFHPNVTMVIFTESGWHYMEDDFFAPCFDERINVGILQNAADSVKEIPAVFEI